MTYASNIFLDPLLKKSWKSSLGMKPTKKDLCRSIHLSFRHFESLNYSFTKFGALFVPSYITIMFFPFFQSWQEHSLCFILIITIFIEFGLFTCHFDVISKWIMSTYWFWYRSWKVSVLTHMQTDVTSLWHENERLRN